MSFVPIDIGIPPISHHFDAAALERIGAEVYDRVKAEIGNTIEELGKQVDTERHANEHHQKVIVELKRELTEAKTTIKEQSTHITSLRTQIGVMNSNTSSIVRDVAALVNTLGKSARKKHAHLLDALDARLTPATTH